MELMQAIMERHSVRRFENRPISEEDAKALRASIEAYNLEGDLHMQLLLQEPKAFNSPLIRLVTHYGHFENVYNYIALIGKKGSSLFERCGYYGEKLVLEAQQRGLRTCWVAGSYKKVPGACDLKEGEKIAAVIAVGYGTEEGRAHKSRPIKDVIRVEGDAPEWFYKGVETALLAPTAMNQQRFVFTWKDGKASVKAFFGPFSRIDLGIVRLHFEISAGRPLDA